MAQTFYDDEEQTNRVLFLISDGEDHEGNVSQIAEEAAEKGIRIFTIGVGTLEGGPILLKKTACFNTTNAIKITSKLSQD